MSASRPKRRLGVCSWSLRPDSPADLVSKVQAAGLDAVQLALGPVRAGTWTLDETHRRLRDADIHVCSGMLEMEGEDYSTLASIRATGGLRPTRHWETNRRAAAETARLARRLDLDLVSFHAGFLPEDPSDPERAVLLERLRTVVQAFDEEGVRVALETGQETAETLLAVLDELDEPTLGVNFDPANMLLYGTGDPLAALDLLKPRIFQVHVKDARVAGAPGIWGAEVPVGRGQVPWSGVLTALAAGRVRADLLIEREAGGDRVGDVRTARDHVLELESPAL
jgi:sugar phosphate isomerase/epimerase